MSEIRYSRKELAHILAARTYMKMVEGTGNDAHIELRMRITPEALDALMRSWIVSEGGHWVRLRSVTIDDKGYALVETEAVDKPEGY